MADKNIGLLPQASTLTDNSSFVCEDSGEAKRVTGKQIKDLAKSGAVEAQLASEEAAAKALASENAAKASEIVAKSSEEAAKSSENAASNSASSASSSALSAETSAQTATQKSSEASASATNAAASAAAAANSESVAASSASSAADSAAAASTSETNARSEADRAKSEADRVAGIIGDYATKTDLSAHTDDTDIHVTASEKATWNAKADAPFKPAGKSYLTFSSPNSFTLAVNDATKHWNGTLEYFASDKTWTVWDGTTTLSAVDNYGEHVLYLRGTGNTVITGKNANYRWILTGIDISCIGNIETLLDYATVESGAHPTMADNCYMQMFYDCTGLTQAPKLPATTLASYCYYHMFEGCTSLVQAPKLPATTMVNSCYEGMFWGCTALIQAPTLPATIMGDMCYREMFRGCTSLTQVPALSATTLAKHCCYCMFEGCTALIQAPTLPATTMVDSCYNQMFSGCTSLTQAPALLATTLAPSCYAAMFQNCTSLTQVPALSATTLAKYCYQQMFNGCTKIKLSSTQTGEYTVAYRIPTSGTSTEIDALRSMFASTGGTFTGTPEINTTYYLSSDNMVVRETEAATLNGYVGSMIDGVTLESIGAAPASHAEDTAIHLPTVTADDNGKLLCVVNGAWAAVSYPSAEGSTF